MDSNPSNGSIGLNAPGSENQAWRGRREPLVAKPAVSDRGQSQTQVCSRQQRAIDFITLTKPKVQLLLIFTTITTMYVAGDPSVGTVFLTCLGGYLSAGGAGAINHYWDRDIDAQMARTAMRPIPSGRIAPQTALWFGIGLGTLAFVELALAVNLLAAALSLSGLLGYVFVYTMWLKRTTPQNIVIGGAAGAVPPLVAWAATTGSLAPAAIYLFAIIFYWTPPHFWALSLLMQKEYAKVRVPMLPVVRGAKETRRHIVLYTLLLVAVTMLPFAGHLFGAFYFCTALSLGALFLAGAIKLLRKPTRRTALHLYLFSLLYLALLFSAMVIDTKVHL